MKKKDRELIKNKYGGRCAYCGCQLGKTFHVDHIEPILRGWRDDDCERYKKQRGANSLDNFNPCCPRCNRWKGTFTVEQFRKEIEQQVHRTRRSSPQFRMAEDYNLVRATGYDVVFCFEKHSPLNP